MNNIIKKPFFILLILLLSLSINMTFSSTKDELPELSELSDPIWSHYNTQNQTNQESLPLYMSWEILVKFKDSSVNMASSIWIASIQQTAQTNNMEIIEQIPINNIVSYRLKNKNNNIFTTISALERDPNIEYAQPNFIYYPAYTIPNDTYWNDLRWIYNTWQWVNSTYWTSDKDMDMLEAWDIHDWSWISSGTWLVVAVLDTWVWYNHPDLINQMRDGTNCVDFSGNALWWCLHWYDTYNDDKDPMSTSSDHWTHVAWTISAQMNNNKWIVWANPNSKIMAIKAWVSTFTTINLVEWINFAKHNWAKIINASLWSTIITGCNSAYDQTYYQAISDFPWLFITAAQNWWEELTSTNLVYPASYAMDTNCWSWLNNIITVSATDQNDWLLSTSNYGSWMIHVWAPWTDIYSTTTEGLLSYYYNIATWSITDFSTWWTTTNFWSYSWTYLYADKTNSPYLSWADNYVQKTFNLSWSKTSYGWGFLRFSIWCDNPSSIDYQDYVDVKIWSWSTWNSLKRIDELQVLIDGWTSTIVNWYTWYYATYNLDISNYINDYNTIRWNWITDSSSDSNAWCFLYWTYRIYTYDDWQDQTYWFKNWTSMATPNVSWLASLIWTYRQDLTYTQVKDAILNYWDSISSLSWKTSTWKRINAYRSLASVAIPTITALNIYKDSTKSTSISAWWYVWTNPYFEWIPPSNKWNMSQYYIYFSWIDNSQWSSWYTSLTGMNWLDYNWWFSSPFSTAWTYSISNIWQNDVGSLWNTLSTTFIVDNNWPSAPSLTYPLDSSTLSWTTTLSWNASTDTWAGMNSWYYKYYISTWSSMTTIISSWSTSSSSVSISWLTDNTYYWFVRWYDAVDNTWTNSAILHFNVDSTPPTIPSNITLNWWNLINASTYTSIILAWSWNSADSWAIIYYTIIDSWTWSISWTSTLWTDWSFQISWINSSTLNDWTLTYSVTFSDSVWNSSSTVTGSIQKEAVSPTWSISITSTITNSSSTSISLTSSESSTYYISWDISTDTLTWSISSTWNETISLSSWDWNKTITVFFIDWAGNISSTYSDSITLDTTAPTISVSSHTNNQQITWSTVTIYWTSSDTNWTTQIQVNWSTASGTGNWYITQDISWWSNSYSIVATDSAWNTGSTSTNIIRITNTSNIINSLTDNTSTQISFNTDLNSTWYVLYGTSSNNLNTTQSSINWTSHSITISSLSSETTYYYQVFWVNDNYTWASSSIKNFTTPKIISTTVITNQTATWDISFNTTWGTLTTITLTWTATISISDLSWSNTLSIPANWLTITSSWWTWNGIIMAPTPISSSGSVTPTTGYELTWDFYEIWNDSTELIFTWQDITISLNVWTSLNGKTMKIYKSTDRWWSYSESWTCTVSNWLCTFTTYQLSIFVLAEPTDTTPDSFNFTDQTGLSISTETYTNEITISWITTSTTISTTNWTLFINWTESWTSSIVNNWNTVKIKLTTSSSWSTTVSATITIWWVSDSFSLTTSTVSSWWSWGWWGWWWWGGGGYNQYISSQTSTKSSVESSIENSIKNEINIDKSSNKYTRITDKLNDLKLDIRKFVVSELNTRDYVNPIHKRLIKNYWEFIFDQIETNSLKTEFLWIDKKLYNLTNDFDKFIKAVNDLNIKNNEENNNNIKIRFKSFITTYNEYKNSMEFPKQTKEYDIQSTQIWWEKLDIVKPIFKSKQINKIINIINEKIINRFNKLKSIDHIKAVESLNNFYMSLYNLKEKKLWTKNEVKSYLTELIRYIK